MVGGEGIGVFGFVHGTQLGGGVGQELRLVGEVELPAGQFFQLGSGRVAGGQQGGHSLALFFQLLGSLLGRFGQLVEAAPGHPLGFAGQRRVF